MDLLIENFVPWIVSNAIALLLIFVAIRKTKLARLLFVFLFSWACWLNYTTVKASPNDYLNYADFTPFTLYYDFIIGWFKTHISNMVTMISIGQGSIAVGMLLKGKFVKIACFGSIIFFIAITPLGIGSGFPFPILASIAIYYILKKDNLDYIWFFNPKKSNG